MALKQGETVSTQFTREEIDAYVAMQPPAEVPVITGDEEEEELLQPPARKPFKPPPGAMPGMGLLAQMGAPNLAAVRVVGVMVLMIACS